MDKKTAQPGCAILVVDDDESICDLLRTALAPRYDDITVSMNAADALSLIEATAFDVVITDLVLPDGSGLDVLAGAKRRDEYTEVLMMTGHASLDSAAAAINNGAGSYLFKPFSIKEFLGRVEKLAASRQFHLRSLQLMKSSDLVDPAVKGHADDITSLYYFTSKLTLTLEIAEVMRITLEEVNQRTGAVFCSIGVNLLDYTEIYSMPLVGGVGKERLEEVFAGHWNAAFSYIDRERWEKGGVPHYVYKGRQGEFAGAAEYRGLNFELTVIGRTIGGLTVWVEAGRELSPSVNQYMHVLTSVVTPIIEHVYKDLQARFQAKTDSLTGIANHRQFYEALEREIARANRKKSRFALVIADIDDFKKINDTHGHQMGDSVIIELTKRLTANIRTGDLAARYGGEEFCLILPDTDLDGALILANRICESVAANPFSDAKHVIPYTASFGLTMYDGSSPISKDELIFKADQAMYKSKHTGKNRVTVG